MIELKVVFLVNDLFVNNLLPLIKKFKKNNVCFTVIAVDRISSSVSYAIKCEEVFAYLKSKDIDCIKMEEDKDFLYSLLPTYVFYSNPYDIYYPAHLRSYVAKKYANVCHISYGSVMIGKLDVLNNPFIKNAKFIFIPEKNEFADNFIQVGNLKLEYYKNLDKKNNYFSKRKIISWKPRWSLESDTSIKICKQLSTFAYENKNIEIKLIVHPLLFFNLRRKGMEDILDLIKKRFTIIDTDEFLKDVLESDVFISDPSSTLVEYAHTGKAAILYEEESVLRDYSDLGLLIKQYCYVSNCSNLIKTLKKILLGMDYKTIKRKYISKKIFEFKNPSQRILDVLLHDFNKNFSSYALKKFKYPQVGDLVYAYGHCSIDIYGSEMSNIKFEKELLQINTIEDELYPIGLNYIGYDNIIGYFKLEQLEILKNVNFFE